MDLANATWLATPSEREDYNPVLPAAVTQPLVALPVKPYTPWPTLAPKYWLPSADFSDGISALAILTSGERTVFTRGAGVLVTWPEAAGEMETAFIYNARLSHVTGAGPWSVMAETGIKGQERLDKEGRYILASAAGNLANQGIKKLAARVISGWAENYQFELGGGSTTFPVRGFDPGWATGDRAVSATLSWRPWELRIERGYSDIPVFCNALALDLFVDAGTIGYGQLGEVQTGGGVEVTVPIELLYGAGGVGYSSSTTLRLSAGMRFL